MKYIFKLIAFLLLVIAIVNLVEVSNEESESSKYLLNRIQLIAEWSMDFRQASACFKEYQYKDTRKEVKIEKRDFHEMLKSGLAVCAIDQPKSYLKIVMAGSDVLTSLKGEKVIYSIAKSVNEDRTTEQRCEDIIQGLRKICPEVLGEQPYQLFSDKR